MLQIAYSICKILLYSALFLVEKVRTKHLVAYFLLYGSLVHLLEVYFKVLGLYS